MSEDITTLKAVFELLPVAAIAASTYWIKSSLRKIDQINILMSDVKSLGEKLGEIKESLNRHEEIRDRFILLEAETKTQWRKIDEVKEVLKDLS